MLNREIVSFRSCVRTRGPDAQWNWISNSAGRAFPFSLWSGLKRGAFPFFGLGGLGERYLFPFGAVGFPFSLPPPPKPPIQL